MHRTPGQRPGGEPPGRAPGRGLDLHDLPRRARQEALARLHERAEPAGTERDEDGAAAAAARGDAGGPPAAAAQSARRARQRLLLLRVPALALEPLKAPAGLLHAEPPGVVVALIRRGAEIGERRLGERDRVGGAAAAAGSDARPGTPPRGRRARVRRARARAATPRGRGRRGRRPAPAAAAGGLVLRGAAEEPADPRLGGSPPGVFPTSDPPPPTSSMSTSSSSRARGGFLPGVTYPRLAASAASSSSPPAPVRWGTAPSSSAASANALGSFARNAPNRSLSFFCLNVSSLSLTIFPSQSGCATLGHGFATCCNAAGMEMIFWIALASLVV